MKIYKVYKRTCLGEEEFCASCKEREIKEIFAYDINLTKGSGICRRTLKIVPYAYEPIEPSNKNLIDSKTKNK